jgi:hypothetical protein
MSGVLLAVGLVLAAVQDAPAPPPRPVIDFQNHDSLTVDFWCRYDGMGRPTCSADRTREGATPDLSSASAWMSATAEVREDLAGWGIEKRVSIRFDPEHARNAAQDSDRYWRFSWPVLENPEWRVGPEAVDPRILLAAVRERDWNQLHGEIAMTCHVRSGGWLGFCLTYSAANREADAASSLDLRSLAWRVAANMRLSEVAADGTPTTDHQVSFVIRFTPPPQGTRPPRSTPPRVVSTAAANVLAPLYPPEAETAGVEGDATYQCISAAEEGPLQTCALYSEAPIGKGFAGATLKVLDMRIVQPQLVDGEPVRSIVMQSVHWGL